MEDNDQLIESVKQWLSIDNEIKTLQKEIKKTKNKKNCYYIFSRFDET